VKVDATYFRPEDLACVVRDFLQLVGIRQDSDRRIRTSQREQVGDHILVLGRVRHREDVNQSWAFGLTKNHEVAFVIEPTMMSLSEPARRLLQRPLSDRNPIEGSHHGESSIADETPHALPFLPGVRIIRTSDPT
jgi:hypothetical protein